MKGKVKELRIEDWDRLKFNDDRQNVIAENFDDLKNALLSYLEGKEQEGLSGARLPFLSVEVV
ncbi:hypothetical protein HS1genome_1723 [Sulfodiicoccus acidiphilus]|uniref:Uncharacterized protein n=1 Tax=Sulfodiicoccus acidiphilus TaxID=1670455 RepID=A0A348B582_9CREN|nr:hypothetical protein HS1genome_1723 [Sulfodiicoccus acidiphilus]